MRSRDHTGAAGSSAPGGAGTGGGAELDPQKGAPPDTAPRRPQLIPPLQPHHQGRDGALT